MPLLGPRTSPISLFEFVVYRLPVPLSAGRPAAGGGAPCAAGMGGDMDDRTLPEGWYGIDGEMARAMLEELHREVAPTHCLRGVTLEAVARRDGNDDVLFRRLDQPGQYCVVHLTWAQTRETSPYFPGVAFVGTLAEFRAEEARLADR